MADTENFDVKVFEANLEEPCKLDKVSCNFIPEVTKVKDGSDYPGKTLYEMVISIQKYLHQNSIFWKIIDDPEFRDVCTVLDNVMKERVERNIGMVRKQANYIDYSVENDLWDKGILGEGNPDELRDTVLFLLGINLGLRAGDEHYNLRRNGIDKPSQLSFERARYGKCCLVYREDNVTKTNDGGLNSLRKEHKIVWVYPSENKIRCPVQIVDQYISLLPPPTPKTKKNNFYLQSLEKTNPAQWYGEQVVGRHTLTKVVGNLLKCVKPGVFYSNHSLRKSGPTRLFQAGVDRKIVKKFTGHKSDAIDKYQVTSDEQREVLSKVISGEKVCESGSNDVQIEEPKLEVNVKKINDSSIGPQVCQCSKKAVTLHKTDEVGSIISQLLASRKGGKATVRLEIEVSD